MHCEIIRGCFTRVVQVIHSYLLKANMDYQCRAESGLQLLARLDTRPSIGGLDRVLFEDGPFPNDIIEISGDASSGKTLLVTQLLAKCLLPKTWQGVHIGGLNAGAVLIDTDHHFQILKLVSVMEGCIMKASSMSPGSSRNQQQSVDTATREKIIEDALENLTILQCYDNIQLMITFHNVEQILCINKNISLLFIDSLSAFYWQNTLDIRGIKKMDFYLKKMLNTLQKHTKEFKICVMYTKPTSFLSKVRESEDCADQFYGFGKVSRKIELQGPAEQDEATCYVYIHSPQGKKLFPYRIYECGLKWCEL